MHEVSVGAVGGLAPHVENVSGPPEDFIITRASLRRINEIQHRVLTFLRELLMGESNRSLQRSIANWVLGEPRLELHELMFCAGKRANEQLRGFTAC